MPNVLKNFRRLRGLGVFIDYTHVADLPDFKKFNLIYGFNGSGKTTLSRVVRSIETGRISPQLPPEGEFTVEFSDGTHIARDTLDGTPNNAIVVFNEDFVEENLRWRDGKASPIYFIGKEQARLSLLLDRLQARLASRDRARADAERTKTRAVNDFRTFKTDRARLIAEELNLGRKYMAPQLEADFGLVDLANFSSLTETERHQRKVAINKVAPRPAISSCDALPKDISDSLRRVKELCEQSTAAAVITDLQQHAVMLRWVKEGLEYHQDHSLEACLFCGNVLTDDRIDQLERSIDDHFAQAIAAVERLKLELAESKASIRACQETLPARSDFDESLAETYQTVRASLIASLTSIDKALSIGVDLLDKKAKAPNLSIPVGNFELRRVSADVEAAQQHLISANNLISRHNDKVARFEQEKAEAAAALKAHYLIDGAATYNDLAQNQARAESEVQLRTRLYGRLQLCIERLQRELRSHGLAVEPLNKLLAAYLGHNDLALATLDDGYQILRWSAPIEGPLSEGEKSAVALCYFLSKLREGGRKISDVVVVIDDPISSLDSKALNYALCLLRAVLGDAGQVILLTHNLQFMNEVKKWLKSLARPNERTGAPPTAALYFLDVQPSADRKRCASIEPLPKLLRDYDSEYHYLFSLILAFMTDDADNEHIGQLLPNVLRKVLELFLMFKMPGPDGLGNKLKHEYVRACGVGEAKVNALYRLVEVESHGDNLDDLLGFSIMTIEETRGAADALLALMQQLDPQHFNRMKSLCA